MNSNLWPIDSSQRLEIAPLRGAALRMAIEQPAALAGVHIEAGLLERLLADAADEPGVLPLLQETMVLLWERMIRRLLPLKAYEDLGNAGRSGLAVAIASKADATMTDLSPEQQLIARRMLLRLVHFGEGRADTRRQQSLAELRSAGEVPEQFDQTVRHLVDNRLLTLSGQEQDAARKVDLAHEILIAGWPRLKKWVDDQREAEQIHRRLEAKANEWVQLGQGSGGLLDEMELPQAEHWLASPAAADVGYSEILSAFIQASRQTIERSRDKERRRVRRLRLLASVLAVLLVLTGIATAFAFYQTQLAEEQTQLAQEQTQLALSRQLAAQALNVQHIPDVSLLLSAAAYQINQSFETHHSLLTGLERYPDIISMLRNQDLVNSIAFSPDGGLLAAAGCGERAANGDCIKGDISFWDVQTHQRLGDSLLGHTATIRSLAWSPDGRMLASGSDDNTVILWDAVTRKPLGQPLSAGVASKILDSLTVGVTSVAFSPDSTILASGGCSEKTSAQGCASGAIQLWDVQSQQAIGQPLKGHSTGVTSIAFSPRGTTLASGSWDATIILWDVATQQSIGQPLKGHTNIGLLPGVVAALAFSPDGTLLASGSWDTTIILWDVVTHQSLGEPLTGHTNWIFSVVFSPDGTILASGSGDTTIILWDVATHQALAPPLVGHADQVRTVAFSPDGRMVASGGFDKTIILWDMKNDASLGQTIIEYVPMDISFILSMALSPDGKTIALGGCGEFVKASGCNQGVILWDVATRRLTHSFLGPTNSVTSLVWSPDGKTLASGSEDKTIIVWDMTTYQPIGTPLTGHTGDINSVAFSPDGKTLASGSDDGTIIVWDVATHQPIDQPLTGTGAIKSVAFSPDGKTLASGSKDGTIILWDMTTYQPIDTPLTGHTGPIRSVIFSPDGTLLASGSDDGTVILWDVATHQPIDQPLTGHSEPVSRVVFSPDGTILASGSDDGTIILWDIVTHQPVDTPLTGHRSSINSVAFSPNGKTLISVDLLDRAIILWDVPNHRPLFYPLGRVALTSLALSPDGKILAAGNQSAQITLWDHTAHIWDVMPRLLFNNLDLPNFGLGHALGIESIAWSPDGKMLATGSLDKTIIVWDMATHQPIGQPLTAHTGPIYSVAFSPDGTILASGSNDGTIILWDIATHQPIGTPLNEHQDWVYSVTFSPDGKMLASGSLDATIILWDVATHQPIGTALTGHTVDTIAFSPDGTTLASGSYDGTIILWDVATHQPIGTPLTGHTAGINSVAFSPDGTLLVSGGEDKTIIVWDVATHQPMGSPLTGHTDAVNSLVFSLDGKTLYSGSKDGRILLWDLDPNSWQARACRIANRNLTQEEWTRYLGEEPYRKVCPNLP